MMTIHAVDLKTGKKSTREWTPKEKKAHEDAIAADEANKTQAQKFAEALQSTESRGELARKLEDITAYIVNGDPLPENPDTGKPFVQEWMETRQAKRAEVTG